MPREKITRNDGRNVHVGWTDSSVQLAILEGSENTGFWSENLSRPDINRLIAELRKARDKAYGRDE